jgi:hypothetical protein
VAAVKQRRAHGGVDLGWPAAVAEAREGRLAGPLRPERLHGLDLLTEVAVRRAGFGQRRVGRRGDGGGDPAADRVPLGAQARPAAPCPQRHRSVGGTGSRSPDRAARAVVDRPMVTASVEPIDLPPFSNLRAVYARCARRVRAYVMFDRDCRQARGDHYHRRCTVCGHEWIEACSERAGSP